MKNDELLAQARRLAESIDKRSVRERALIFMAALVVLIMAANALLFAPLRSESNRLERSFKEKSAQNEQLAAQRQVMVDGMARDPDTDGRARLEALRARIKQMDADLNKLVAGFVSPQEMAKYVEQALKQNRRLEFVKVENLPPTSVPERAAGEPADEFALYKHGMRIEMRGGYREIVSYLAALEALPWKVFWGEVTLEAEKYPVSRVSVVVYTLSRSRGWIGT